MNEPTAKELLTAALGSLAHWQRNEYVNGEWADGCNCIDCDLCCLMEKYPDGTSHGCAICPLRLIGAWCYDVGSSYKKAALLGDKTALIAALEEAVAYCAARVLIEEYYRLLEEQVKQFAEDLNQIWPKKKEQLFVWLRRKDGDR